MTTLTAEVKALLAKQNTIPPQPSPLPPPSGNHSHLFLSGGGFEMPNPSHSNRDNRTQTPFEFSRQRRVDLPSFSGDNSDAWISQAEHYFSIYHLEDKEKIDAVIVSFEGKAVTWRQWIKQHRRVTSWSELMLLHHFMPHDGSSLWEQWMSIFQDGSVAEYCEKFISLASPLSHVPEGVLLSSFYKRFASSYSY